MTMEPVCWANDQWGVGPLGLEAFEKGYAIEASRLCEIIRASSGNDYYFWPYHLASEEEWVDVPAFLEAFEFGMKLFGHRLIPETMLRTTLMSKAARMDMDALWEWGALTKSAAPLN